METYMKYAFSGDNQEVVLQAILRGEKTAIENTEEIINKGKATVNHNVLVWTQ
jgi:hypothetical protein